MATSRDSTTIPTLSIRLMVMSYSVAQQTREIGIRIALGAKRSDVLRMTVAQGLRLVAVGLVIGLAIAFLLTRVMSSLLFGISATDPLTFFGIALLLLAVSMVASYITAFRAALVMSAVSLVACLIPAHRATKVDPMIALRAE